jgi:hypothetical protein
MKHNIFDMMTVIRAACERHPANQFEEKCLLRGIAAIAAHCNETFRSSDFHLGERPDQPNLEMIRLTAEGALDSGEYTKAISLIRDASWRVAGLPEDIS